METCSSDIARPIGNETVEPLPEVRVEFEFVRSPGGYDPCMSTDFLDRLAAQRRASKSAAGRPAMQRIAAVAKRILKKCKYINDVEAEADFPHLVERDKAANELFWSDYCRGQRELISFP